MADKKTVTKARAKELAKQARALIIAERSGVIDAAAIRKAMAYYRSIHQIAIWNREARAAGLPQYIDEIPF